MPGCLEQLGKHSHEWDVHHQSDRSESDRLSVLRYMERLEQCRFLHCKSCERRSCLFGVGTQLPDGVDYSGRRRALCAKRDNLVYLDLVCLGRCGCPRWLYGNLDRRGWRGRCGRVSIS